MDLFLGARLGFVTGTVHPLGVGLPVLPELMSPNCRMRQDETEILLKILIK